MDVPLSGGRLSSLGSNCVDVYPPRGVSIVGWGPGAGHVKAVLQGGLVSALGGALRVPCGISWRLSRSCEVGSVSGTLVSEKV